MHWCPYTCKHTHTNAYTQLAICVIVLYMYIISFQSLVYSEISCVWLCLKAITSCIKRDIFSSTVKRWYLYDYIDDYMYESMYSVQILTKIFIHFIRKKKWGISAKSVLELRWRAGYELDELRRTLPLFRRQNGNIQKYKWTRKCPFTLSVYIISLYV